MDKAAKAFPEAPLRAVVFCFFGSFVTNMFQMKTRESGLPKEVIEE